jgi:hypothetical protein
MEEFRAVLIVLLSLVFALSVLLAYLNRKVSYCAASRG